MVLERRALLAGAGLAWLLSLGPAGAQRLAASDVVFASAYKDRQGAYGIAFLDQDGAIVARHLLPGRGHGFASHPQAGWLVAFARRPGNFAVALDPESAREPVVFHTPADRHFYGHGAFSADGQLLFAAENAFETGDGVLGVYDVTNGFARIGEFPSHGIGPHEILLMPDAKTLCVANGGIRTHPDNGRQKLNLPTMASSMAFIDLESGSLLSSHSLPDNLRRLSLRHMAADARGQVWIGGQYEGDPMDVPPVLARLNPDAGLQTVELPNDVKAEFGMYVGAVAASNDGARLAITSPKTGRLVTLDAQSGKVLGSIEQPGVCGIQASARGFVSSTETGEFAHQQHDLLWDNHIAVA
ncbi:DUF1513 domain-containing protein [Hoeflea sp. G2-23]|uniref:DUF1513 domain-containing protein n=1 Tax=Hoeflea algicola TaxID=2983763 RepID=A0ABT3ZDN9_9HYPH|nr:DUF1513 domain-containing protein [Hoeflea algicola]MCY0149897.1 DUF1513 domain-containing protein [Hoeflea algicola]